MRKLFAVAALLLATTGAQAGDSYSFEINGQSIRIDAPRDCNSTSCVSISIPGVYESTPKRDKRTHDHSSPERDAKATPEPKPRPQQATPAPVQQPPVAAAVPSAPAPVEQQSLAPANGPAATATDPVPAPAPAAAAAQPAAAPRETPAAGLAPPVIAPAPAPKQQTAAIAAPGSAEASPLGVWWTEEKEGKIRIEPCGNNLCGYSVDAKSDQNGEKILINMKPISGSKWSGRIHDPKSGGNYDSTIALKGSDRLQVQGCAFGGMFCGGQTWSRVN